MDGTNRPDLRRDCDRRLPLVLVMGIVYILEPTDLIYEGIATIVHLHIHALYSIEPTDLIYEGIATRI